MGRVAGAYGVNGWVRVVLYGDAPDTLAATATWQVGESEYAVLATKFHSGALLAKLSGVETREAALKLRGQTVVLPREALPDPGEGSIYWADLVGLEVVNGQGDALGVVERVFSNGAHEVIELAGERQRLLPWVPAVVKRVDLDARRVEVDWQTDW
jgi:16S rRNA processing protein RimM